MERELKAWYRKHGECGDQLDRTDLDTFGSAASKKYYGELLEIVAAQRQAAAREAQISELISLREIVERSSGREYTLFIIQVRLAALAPSGPGSSPEESQ